MKSLQKLILPAMFLTIIAVVYFVFFSPYKGLSSFSSIDPNSHVPKELKVKLVIENGIDESSNPPKKLFYVQDKSGQKMLVAAADLPADFHNAEEIIIVGHIHGEVFEAAEIRLE